MKGWSKNKLVDTIILVTEVGLSTTNLIENLGQLGPPFGEICLAYKKISLLKTAKCAMKWQLLEKIASNVSIKILEKKVNTSEELKVGVIYSSIAKEKSIKIEMKLSD